MQKFLDLKNLSIIRLDTHVCACYGTYMMVMEVVMDVIILAIVAVSIGVNVLRFILKLVGMPI